MQKYVPLLGILLLGCSVSDQWAKPGASQEDYANDRRECEIDAEDKYGEGVLNVVRENQFIEECLRDRGWTDIS